MYAYLRSQVGRGDQFADGAEGLLLHPSIGASLDEALIIQGHRIRFMTVDLASDISTIRAELLRVAQNASETCIRRAEHLATV